jgi:hypothetical protein
MYGYNIVQTRLSNPSANFLSFLAALRAPRGRLDRQFFLWGFGHIREFSGIFGHYRAQIGHGN